MHDCHLAHNKAGKFRLGYDRSKMEDGPVMWLSPRERYRKHKSNAKSRGIPFRLTFPEWWKIWKDSGMYERGGRFVMHRFSDEGPYAVGNVEIISRSDNFREAMEIHYMGERNYI
jgi:hypothetical protein